MPPLPEDEHMLFKTTPTALNAVVDGATGPAKGVPAATRAHEKGLEVPLVALVECRLALKHDQPLFKTAPKRGTRSRGRGWRS